MDKINLAGEWKLTLCDTNKTYPAVLPGSDIGNLIKCGAIENPLILGDDKIGEALGERDVEFSRQFKISEKHLSYNHISLKSKGFDTLCTVYINGRKVLKTKNAHIPVDIDIREHLQNGENEITLHFESSVNYIKSRQKEKPLPKNNNGTDGASYLRKPSCHFGWDWGPCVPYNSVNESIELKCFNSEIQNISIRQNTSIEKSIVTVSADNADTIYILAPNGDKISSDNNTYEIINPELWYTADMSGRDTQPLYKVVFEGAEEKVEKQIGLRSLYLERKPDKYGENFRFILNGERIFAKGANLIPFSAIYEDSDNSTIDYYLDLAQKSHFNIIRVWGGGSYASDYFIEQCDKRGILIWQDFCFACLMYPFYEKDFCDNVLDEVKANVTRLSTHPSLALLCGNNEIEAMFAYLPRNSELVKWYIKFFYEILPEYISPLTDTSYIPSSPLGEEPFKSCSADGVGDTHMWNVWHGLKKLDYYQTRYTRFLSEFGLESLPSMKAIRTFADEKELSITSDSFNRHQKCIGGNRKMLFYLKEMFDEPVSFEDLPYLTGIIQAECVKNATVHFRQNPDRCNGVIFWQYNDVWNCPSWSSVDFEGIPKALQYKAKEFFEPVTITCKNDNGTAVIFAHNDTISPVEFTAEIEINNTKFKKEYTVKLAPNESRPVDKIKVNKNAFMQIKYFDKVKTEIFDAPKNLRLKKANISYELNGCELTLQSDTFAYGVCIEADTLPQDNYFSLAPNEKRTVSFNEAPKDIHIRCTNNIQFKKNRLKQGLSRLFYRLEPMNIGNYVYYSTN